MVYSVEERIQIVFLYGAEGMCYLRTARAFNERNPDKNVSHVYVRDLIKKFQQTGSVKNKKREGPRVLNEETQIEVIGQVSVNPEASTRQLASITGIARTSVRRVLKMQKFHPYKMKILQELGDDDPDRRIQFCELMTEEIRREPSLTKNICFSDESSFFLNGNVNKQNCRYWSDENPHIVVEGHTQNPQKLNVWCGILGDKIIGPFFIDGNLTGDAYVEMLNNLIEPSIVNEVENQRDLGGNLNLNEDLIHFQQDGAPPHYAIITRRWLDRFYPRQWIGRRGPIEWPPRSPDLTPLDFFLWGYIKSIVYKTKPASLQELRQRIIEACRNIPREIFQKVREEFENRLYFCMEQNGCHFEQLLK